MNSNRELLAHVFKIFKLQPLALTGNWFISLSTCTVIDYAINFTSTLLNLQTTTFRLYSQFTQQQNSTSILAHNS